jgi:hypothetical protein
MQAENKAVRERVAVLQAEVAQLKQGPSAAMPTAINDQETLAPQQFPQSPASLPTNQPTESGPRGAIVTPEPVPRTVPALLRRFVRRSP